MFVDNDANVAVLAEHRAGGRARRGYGLMLTIGTGIGGGLILDGEVYRGSSGRAPSSGTW